MTIIKGLNHAPSDGEKQKLGEMITRLEEIKAECNKRHEERKSEYKKERRHHDDDHDSEHHGDDHHDN